MIDQKVDEAQAPAKDASSDAAESKSTTATAGTGAAGGASPGKTSQSLMGKVEQAVGMLKEKFSGARR